MNVNILKSGSSGNCVVIDDTIIIDAGYCPEVTPKGRAVLVTHSHSDHVKCLDRFADLPIYTSKQTADTLSSRYPFIPFNILKTVEDVSVFDMVAPTYRIPFDAKPGEEYLVRAVLLNHDVPCIGFDIQHDGERILYATDFSAFRENINVRDYTALYLECNNTLQYSDMADVFFSEAEPKDGFHRRKSFRNHCNSSYLYHLFESAGFSESNPCDIPLTLLHKSTYYYSTTPEEIIRLCRIANVKNPLL